MEDMAAERYRFKDARVYMVPMTDFRQFIDSDSDGHVNLNEFCTGMLLIDRILANFAG
jgi:hypothetical protein